MQYLALDVGGSSIKHALIDDAYLITEKGGVPTSYATNNEFIETIGGLYDRYAGNVAGIAISTCGELDPVTGHMFSGGALRFNAGTNMIERVAGRCGVPVSVENDANCALLAEVHDGSLTDCTNAAALVIGTGVGGAVMINRHIYHGSHFHSGNASVTITALAEPFSFGRAFARTNGVGGLTRPLAERRGLPAEAVDGRAFFAALEAGDQDAAEVLDAFCHRLAGFIYNVQALLDVDAFAIGGGISVQPVFVDTVRTKVREMIGATPIPLPAPEIRTCRHFNEANLLGALYHHLHPRV